MTVKKMTKSMEAAALLGVAERELGKLAHLPQVAKYIQAVDRYMEAVEQEEKE